jgi:recombination protein RecA
MSKTKDPTEKQIIKKYGNVIRSGADVFDEMQGMKIIPVSPAIDLALGGGIREGSWVIFTGLPKTGKSTAALQFAATCQTEEYGNRPIIYLNSEGRLSPLNLGGIKGLDSSKLVVIESTDEPLSAEQYLSIAETYIRDKPECVLIIDSVSSLIPERELLDEVSGQFRAGLPKILSNFTKRLGNVVPKQRAIVIMITHFIANTTGYGKSRISDSGNKIRYQVDTHMEIKSIKPWEVDGEQVGQMITWKVLCSAAGGFPGGEAESWLRYGIGLDKTQELLHKGLEFGLINRSGAWYNFEVEGLGDTEVKFQGQDKIYSFLLENKDVSAALESKIKEAL